MGSPLDELLKKVKAKKSEPEEKEIKEPKPEEKIPAEIKEEKPKPKPIITVKDFKKERIEKQKTEEKIKSKEQAKEELKKILSEPEEKPTQSPMQGMEKIIEKNKIEMIKKLEEKRKEITEEKPEKSDVEKQLEEEEKKEIDHYGKTTIYELKSGLNYYYTPVPRPTGPEKAIINTLKEAATRLISVSPYKIRDPEQRRNVYYERIMEMLRESPELRIPESKYEFYVDAIVREMVGYGLIDELIKDDQLEEIMIIGSQKPVYVFHRKYEMMLTNIEFYSEKDIEDLINRIARQIGRRVDISSPLLDARLPDGSRVNATIPPASASGASLTIRKFKADPYSIIDLMNNGTFSSELAAYLWMFVEGLSSKPANILIAGGTGSGKTTTLNVLASFIPERERIISIEDTAELNLPLQHWIRMEAR
ncbi:MAG: ATPase, T2SS/T4P/T4SS family, partial [Candidatus Diapherotrites archaeon]